MSKRGWGILIGVIAGLAVAMIVGVVLSGAGEPVPTPVATPAAPETAVESASPTPSITPAAAAVAATCQTTSTQEFQAMMAQNAWISWETQNEQIGARPFERFPDATPEGAIVCRWGESPDLATDNLIDLAWTPIGTDAATAAQQMLVAEGYQRVDAPEGVYLAMPATSGPGDSEGFGDSYLFTADDVRWAMTKADLSYIKAPDEAG